jgi:hypothetical protein
MQLPDSLLATLLIRPCALLVFLRSDLQNIWSKYRPKSRSLLIIHVAGYSKQAGVSL